MQLCPTSRPLLCACLACLGQAPLAAATLPSAEWRNVQSLAVPATGLVKIALPPETLGAARPGLADLRVVDAEDHEVPYAIERTVPAAPHAAPAKSFAATLTGDATVLVLETGFTQALESVALRTTAVNFIKAAQVDGSQDGRAWTVLARGVPLFRQAGAEQLRVPLAPQRWPWLRLTVDDRRSEPVAFTGADLQATATEAPTHSYAVDILGHDLARKTSRVALRLPAANLELAALELETPEPLFTREVTVLAREVTDLGTNEASLARSTLFRLSFDGQPAMSNLTVRVEALAPTRDLVLEIANQDSPPLAISAVRARVRPVYAVFRPTVAGRFRLLTGNRACPAPRYDLAALGTGLAGIAPSSEPLGPLTPNPAYQPPRALPGVEDRAAELDVSNWPFRKPVCVTRPGAQILELDLEVLSAAGADLADLRMMRGATQVPFLRDPGAVQRAVAADVGVINDPKQARLSRWQITLPHPGLPLTRLTCDSPDTLFQRQMLLFEEVGDERGARYRRSLGQATWARTPGQVPTPLELELIGRPESATLILETDNGDNPPLKLDQFEVTAAVPRLVFTLGTPAADLFLYYGNPRARPPSYDLSLVARELQTAEKATATLRAAEQLQPGAWRNRGAGGLGSPILWVVLALVAGGLVALIVGLLPKPADAAGDQPDAK